VPDEKKSKKTQEIDAQGRRRDFDPFADIRSQYQTPGTVVLGTDLPNKSPRMRPLTEQEMKDMKRKGYKDGGKVKDKDVIDFTGDELDDLERTAKRGPGGRGEAGAKAFIGQTRKGKSLEASSDAADVVRGFTRPGMPMYPGSKTEETKAFRDQARSGDKKRTAFAKGGFVPFAKKGEKPMDAKANPFAGKPGKRPVKMAKGGMACAPAKKMADGGKVKKYAAGGAVARGMGCALRGGKYQG
jgi:hypothetical protein